MIGTRLAHYEVVRKLGSGGMGEVFAARDTKLNRQVALKLLPESLADDPVRLARFEREAKSVAALSHPNIVTIYAVEEADGVRFMTMELIIGQTLDQLIPREGMPVKEFLDIAVPLADAVAAAHERNILHRDLKPANIMVDDAGRVKVLDFGLAKINEQRSGPDGMTQMLTGDFTGEGKILGTIAYMSPEQAEGRSLDHRSDIFSLGILLYEMITGKRPFDGETNISVLSSILKDDPDSVSDVRQAIPLPIARLIQRTLAKQPDQRYQTAADLRRDLKEIRRDLETGELLSSRLHSDVSRVSKLGAYLPGSKVVVVEASSWLRYGALAVAVVAVLTIGYFGLRDRVEPGPRVGQPPAFPTSLDGQLSVAVFYFDNISGDPELEWLRSGLTEMLVTDLSQIPGVRVLATDRLYSMLQGMGRLGDSTTSGEVVGEIARLAGMNRAIVGSFARAGDEIRINARIQDPDSSEVLSSGSVQGSVDELFDLVDELHAWIEASFDMSHADHDAALSGGAMGYRDIEEVTTDNIEAFRFYNEGVELNLQSKYRDAVPLLERAVELDPDFAMAHAKLSVAHGNLGDKEIAARYAQRAFDMADRLPPRERHYIRGRDLGMDPRTITELLDEYAKAVESYPDHLAARTNLAQGLMDLERFDEAIEHFEELRQARDSFAPNAYSMAFAYAARGRVADAVTVLREYVEANPDNAEGYFNLAAGLARNSAYDEALEELATANRLVPEYRKRVLRWGILVMQERWDEARAETRTMLQDPNPKAKFEGYLALSAQNLYFGQAATARTALQEAGTLFPPGSMEHQRALGAQVELARSLADAELTLERTEELRRTAPEPANPQLVALNEMVGRVLAGDEARARQVADAFRESIAGVPLTEIRQRRAEAQIDGVIAWASGDLEAAVPHLRTTLELLPTRDLSDEGLAMRFILAESLWLGGHEEAAARELRAVEEASMPRVDNPIMSRGLVNSERCQKVSGNCWKPSDVKNASPVLTMSSSLIRER